MEDIQPFKSSLWEFYITHHWFLHKDKDGHKEPPDRRLSLRRAAVCVFADSSKASRSCGHCCAGRTPLLIPRQNTVRKQLIFFFFLIRQWGEKEKGGVKKKNSSFSHKCDLRAETLVAVLEFSGECSALRGGPPRRYCKAASTAHISQMPRQTAHDGDTVAFISEELCPD